MIKKIILAFLSITLLVLVGCSAPTINSSIQCTSFSGGEGDLINPTTGMLPFTPEEFCQQKTNGQLKCIQGNALLMFGKNIGEAGFTTNALNLPVACDKNKVKDWVVVENMKSDGLELFLAYPSVTCCRVDSVQGK